MDRRIICTGDLILVGDAKLGAPEGVTVEILGTISTGRGDGMNARPVVPTGTLAPVAGTPR
jgi:hypothetical protein